MKRVAPGQERRDGPAVATVRVCRVTPHPPARVQRRHTLPLAQFQEGARRRLVDSVLLDPLAFLAPPVANSADNLYLRDCKRFFKAPAPISGPASQGFSADRKGKRVAQHLYQKRPGCYYARRARKVPYSSPLEGIIGCGDMGKVAILAVLASEMRADPSFSTSSIRMMACKGM